MKYISVSLYRKMLAHAMREGLTEADFKDLPIGLDTLDSIRAVPADIFFALHEQLDALRGPGFAVRVGQHMEMDDYGVLGLSWKTCSKAGEIFERCERYFHLLSNTYLFKVKKRGEESDVFLYRDVYRPGVGFSNEATFSATVVVLQAMTETNIKPLRVSFTHKAPADIRHHQQAFGEVVLFQQAYNSITYRTRDLETRTAKADVSINRFLLERVEEEQKGVLISSVKVVADVEALIRDTLPSGIPAIAHISQHMGMSGRTLARRLAEHGLSFRDLVQQTQATTAKELLRNSSYSISEIAFQTGFSEQSAFSRAFKRWTGSSPLEFRNPL